MKHRIALAALALGLLSGAAHGQGAIVGDDSGPVSVEVTLGAGSLSSGNALGLFAVPIARVPNGSGIITGILWKSVNADTTAKQAKIWAAKPVNTTCTNGSAFVASDVDDAFLIGPGIFNFTPAAPTITTGDSATYATSLTGLTWDFKNMDGIAMPQSPGSGGTVVAIPSNGIAPSQNIYVCVISGGSDTLDVSHNVRLTISGPRN